MDEEPHTVSVFPLFHLLAPGNINKFGLIFNHSLCRCYIHKLFIIIYPKNATPLPIHHVKGFNHSSKDMTNKEGVKCDMNCESPCSFRTVEMPLGCEATEWAARRPPYPPWGTAPRGWCSCCAAAAAAGAASAPGRGSGFPAGAKSLNIWGL